MINNNTKNTESQYLVNKVLTKTAIKKKANKPIIKWLKSQNQNYKAERLENCANYLGITVINHIAHVVRADLCRERICAVCAWRRQSKFVAQMNPVLENLKAQGYEFIFATLTIKNCYYSKLSDSIDILLKAYDRLLKRKKIKRAWKGVTRSLELTFNEEAKTFHPHLHLLIAVDSDYFKSEDYITQEELTQFWKECASVKYKPQVDIRKVTDESGACVEVLKYALKPSEEQEAWSAFFYILKGRRLVSFSGIFAQERKRLKLSSLEILTDYVKDMEKNKYTYTLYKLDVTGGVYTYIKEKDYTL